MSNEKNLIKILGLKPCPLCGHDIKINSIGPLDKNGYISNMEIYCNTCKTTYSLDSQGVTFKCLDTNEIVFTSLNVIDLWNSRGELSDEEIFGERKAD